MWLFINIIVFSISVSGFAAEKKRNTFLQQADELISQIEAEVKEKKSLYGRGCTGRACISFYPTPIETEIWNPAKRGGVFNRAQKNRTDNQIWDLTKKENLKHPLVKEVLARIKAKGWDVESFTDEVAYLWEKYDWEPYVRMQTCEQNLLKIEFDIPKRRARTWPDRLWFIMRVGHEKTGKNRRNNQ